MTSPTKKYTRQGQYGSDPEPQTKPRMQGTPSGAPQPPGALSPHDVATEARIRLKEERGEALNEEERAFLARMPADSEVPPEAFRE